jgi:hypothetical protein
MNSQKLILPGLILGILGLIGFTRLLTSTPVSTGGLPSTGETAQQAAPVKGHSESSATDCSINTNYPDSILQWCGLIEQYAQENSIDPNLVSALILQESAGRPDAYSKSGAVGLMQVMPRDGKAAGFMCKNGPCFAGRPSMSELFDPEFNVAYGTRMLAGLIRNQGSLREALKAYGPKDVGYYYADLVMGIFQNHQ